jgi:hypothetical protein
LARIRTIKPEFWTNERVMECSANARLLFIGMWNFADDLGRLALAPKTIKAQIFPSDDISFDTVRGMIQELSKNGLLLIYEVEGKEYLQIVGCPTSNRSDLWRMQLSGIAGHIPRRALAQSGV